MVNRVFCYSKNVARENKLFLPLWQLVLSTIVFIGSFVFLPIIMGDNKYQDVVFIFMVVLFLVVLLYYSFLLGLRLRNRLVAYATDTNGRTYKVMMVNNGQGLTFAGFAVGGAMDTLLDSNSNLGRDIGGILGASAEFYAINRSSQYMGNPEVVSKIIEEFPNVTGAEVFEILRVYSIEEKRHSIKVKCDIKMLRNNKIKYNKNLKIAKSYNRYEEFISLLNTHK